PQLEKYYNLYQLLLFHLQEKNIEQFFGLIQEALPQLNHPFKIALTLLNSLILTLNLKQPINSSKILNVMLLVTGTLTTLKNAFTSL
ncbi:hypothetical protein SAMN04487840_1101, partial [Streptococcus gallolyticus]